MKITLISLDQLIISYGLRIISSCLKKEGNEVTTIFARAVIGQPLTKTIEKQIGKLCKDSDLIGISLMSNHFPQAISLTKYLQKITKKPIIWGGIHPTFDPEECLKHVDIICVGEGEQPILELIKKLKKEEKINNIPGIWYKDKKTIVRNGIGSLFTDLDKLPFADFGPEGHYIRDGQKIKTMSSVLFQKFLTKRESSSGEYVSEYYISSSRGCPFRCAYCASNSIKDLYSGQKFFRLRSPEKVIEEVSILIKKFNFIKWIYFADDDLLASSTDRINKFCFLWKEKINLPFYATVAPWSYNEDKMKMFMDAGLGVINMGIQTVSHRGGTVYHRLVPKAKLKEIIKSIHRLKFSLPPVYDFILDNPYEKDIDRLENLDFILSIPKPRKFQLFSLIPFPGTEIYKKMKIDGILKDEEKMIYQKSYSYPEANYINMLIFLANTNFPLSLIKTLRNDLPLFIFNNKISKTLFRAIPYDFFMALIKNIYTYRFWSYNAVPKGDN